jgi:hypothetical protein
MIIYMYTLNILMKVITAGKCKLKYIIRMEDVAAVITAGQFECI